MTDIRFFNDCSFKFSCNSNKLKKIIFDILKEEDKIVDSVSVIFVNQNKLSKLKKEFFNKDHFTDVIAFNLEDEGAPIEGEVYISLDDVMLNSKEYNVSFNEEFKRVLVHGILHLIGYDDDTNIKKQEMRELENKYLNLYELDVIHVGK